MKTAIFVEGQTELIFVREYLLKKFDYQDIGIQCKKKILKIYKKTINVLHLGNLQV